MSIKKPKIIRKKLNYTPNLQNYEKTAKNFCWKDYYDEVAWLEKNKKLNTAHNAIDKHLGTDRENTVALYWVDDDLKNEEKYTFRELSELSNQFANVLKSLGIQRGERVFIFLPRIPELYISFLGTVKTGAISGTMFSAFGEQALYDRLENSDARILVTDVELLPRIKKILKDLPQLEKVLVVTRHNKKLFKPTSSKFLIYEKLMTDASDEFKPAKMDPDEPAFMLYTSGTTGKPKGVIHQHLSALSEHLTAKWVLDLQDSDTYWCTADPGWVTGIAYNILGSWSNGAASVVYKGRFDPKVWYQVLEKYRVSVWYTAPTAVRLLMAAGNDLVKKYDLSNLRHLCSVGEPLNPEAVFWGLDVFGLPFHDNWWQTETGGICIANYPCLDIKPGSMGKPVPGIEAEIVDDQGNELGPNTEGDLALRPGWPSQMSKIWRRPKKFESYFVKNKKGEKWYLSGDRAFKDKDGYFWFIGRADDVIKTSGERVGPFEVESALVEYPGIIEAGVIGKPDPIRGEAIKAFVIVAKNKFPDVKIKTFDGYKFNPKEKISPKQMAVIEKIQKYVKTHLAGHAYPREIEFLDYLPKTRSGKIMRRMLKAKELGLKVGDTSTLER